ncbi:MAG: hypothetical protein OSB19_15580 [Opitutaceae bacterium]|nr:hypothetical protein [Opitutaceae bacterium]
MNFSSFNGKFKVSLYNPRTGEYAGKRKTIQVGSKVSLGTPPSDDGQDWVVLVKR